ncbi:MAG: peptide chain release factor N(5)-glutamine methyltransferase [Rhodospirillales bacterium]|nr:peptide chain release factor N(5)-glutamine methyltransferase [Rhodospirillales bacterium]
MIEAVTQSQPFVAEVLNDVSRRLKDAGFSESRLESRLLVAAALGIEPEMTFVHSERTLNGNEWNRLESLLTRRLKCEPMAYILGEREFWSLSFRAGPGVLVPRPDSETIIDSVLSHVPERNRNWNILDLGTGSGCLLLSLLKEYPASRGTGVDVSGDALALAIGNAGDLGLSPRVEFIKENWCDGLEGPFDIVVCNPPYIPTAEISDLSPEVSRYEPRLALDGGEDGLNCYRLLAPMLGKIISREGWAFVEIGVGQARDVSGLFIKNRLHVIDIMKDIQGIARCVILRKCQD